MDLIISEKHRNSLNQGYSRVMESGVTRYSRTLLAVPALTKDGRRISVEFSVVLLKEPTGGVVGIAAFLQGVTQRWERDKALRARLTEAEASAHRQ